MSTPYGIGFGVPGGGNQDVNRFHDYDDLDIGILSHHHTLGIQSSQASPGNHRHTGTDQSLQLAWDSIKERPPFSVPGAVEVALSSAYTLTDSFADVTGLTISILAGNANRTVVITSTLESRCTTAVAGAISIGELQAAGVSQSGNIVGSLTSVNFRGSFSRTWVHLPGAAATTYKMRARKDNAGAAGDLRAPGSNLVVVVFDFEVL